MDRAFEGKIALVTGAGSGIGRTTTLAFAQAGATVILSDVDAIGGRAALADIKAAGGDATFIPCDVSDEASVAAMFDQVISVYGRLDCAFNNAGVEVDDPGDWGAVAAFQKTLSINALGVLLCMRREIAQMVEQGGGAIVNAGSVAALSGTTNAAYCASKHAVVGLTRSAALRFARDGVRVNAVCPGAIRTPMIERTIASSAESKAFIEAMHPLGRVGEPQEVADAVLWLCSDRASFITGHTLAIDGGFTAG